MDSANPLGEFLRARRELVQPQDVGLQLGGLRRVPGLRREEVAMLAGISADYYLRLEQGRDRHPSVQVLEAIARVLRLDTDATAYLLDLGLPRPKRIVRPTDEKVPPSILALLETLELPAYVQGKYLDVLAVNGLARALSPRLRVGDNRMLAIFLDDSEHELYPDWEKEVVGYVAGLRIVAGTEPDDPRLAALVGELSVKSERFRRIWARHDVRRRQGGATRMHHPEVGDLEIMREKLAIGGTDGQLLVIYHAAAGSESARLLSLLGSIASSTDDGADRVRTGRVTD